MHSSTEAIPSLKGKVTFYNLAVRADALPRPSQPVGPPRKKTKGHNVVDKDEDTTSVLVKISERLLPPQLWKVPVVKLNTDIDISKFQSLPKPHAKPKGRQRKSATSERLSHATSSLKTASSEPSVALGERPSITTKSLDKINLRPCGCIIPATTNEANVTFCTNCNDANAFVLSETVRWFVNSISQEKVHPLRPLSKVAVTHETSHVTSLAHQ